MRKKNLEKIIISYIVENEENNYRLAYSYVKNADDALDIVQEAVYKAITSVNTLKNPEFVKTWFYKIVVNTSLDFLRKRKKVEVVDEKVLEFCSHGADDHYQDLDLQKVLNDLPPNYRSVIVLRYFEDLKIEEVASVLNENVNTVKTRLYSALKRLRVKMKN